MERSPEGKQEPRRTDDTVEQRQIKAKKRYRIKQTGYLFLVALAVITAIGGLSAASAYVDNFSVTALKDIFAIVGGPLAIAYFVFRVGYQKQYQRLSSDVAVTVLGPCDGKLLVEIACIITNEAECRINFSFATFQVYDGTKDYPSAHDSLLCNDKFPTNLYWVEPRDKETQGFSVDAKSNIRLAKKARLPPGGGIVFIEAEFSPNHTEETYIVGRLFVINPVS